ncbi:hypothetical protein [Streptomyces cinereoruber]|uniref:hypothetical protein n=1 Tax=Streptomyces cinereoruber TaxID=67260 RepID=UPI003628AA78
MTTSGNTIMDTPPPQGLTHFGALFAPRNLRAPCTTTTLLTGADFPQSITGSQFIQFRQAPTTQAMIPGHFTVQQVTDRFDIKIKNVCNLNDQEDNFPEPINVGRAPLRPVSQLDTWRERHPARKRP